MANSKAAPSLIAVTTSLTVVLAGVVFGALLWLADAASLLGIWLRIVVVPGFVAYLYSVSWATVAGYREPAPAAITHFNAVNVGAQLLHAALFFVPLVWLARADWPLKGAGLIVVAVLPASFLLLAATRDIIAAFSPPQIKRLIAGLGLDYLKFLAFVFGLGFVLWYLAKYLSSIVLYVGAAYAALALAAAGGHLLYRHRLKLDLPVVTIDEKRERRDRLDEELKWQSVMDEAYLLLRNAETDKAYALLRGQIARDGDRVESYEAVYLRMREWGMEYHTSQVARRLVERLVAANQLQRALEVAQERLRHDETFRAPSSSGAALAAYARSVGHVAIADLLDSPPPVAQDSIG